MQCDNNRYMCVNLLNNKMMCEKGCQEFGSPESLYKHTHTHTHNSLYNINSLQVYCENLTSSPKSFVRLFWGACRCL